VLLPESNAELLSKPRPSTVVAHSIGADMRSNSIIVAYDWTKNTEEDWRGFLLPSILPEVRRVRAGALDDWQEVWTRIVHEYGFPSYLFFHINLTRPDRLLRSRPHLIRRLEKAGTVVVNAGVKSISKRHVQAVCRKLGLPTVRAERRGDPDEWLLIKTDRNFGGLPEGDLSDEERHSLGIAPAPWSANDDHDYSLVKRSDIPSNTWNDPSLVVERYISNFEPRFYRAYLLFHRLLISEGREATTVKSIDRSTFRRDCSFDLREGDKEPVNPELIRAKEIVVKYARSEEIRFACFDLMQDDTREFYLVDVNPTPWWEGDYQAEILPYLREGLADCRTDRSRDEKLW
jgi:hypothetical protein